MVKISGICKPHKLYTRSLCRILKRISYVYSWISDTAFYNLCIHMCNKTQYNAVDRQLFCVMLAQLWIESKWLTLRKACNTMLIEVSIYIYVYVYVYMTGPEKTSLIYTKYTWLYYDTYLIFWICYSHSVSFIDFLIDLCMYDKIFAITQNNIKKLVITI